MLEDLDYFDVIFCEHCMESTPVQRAGCRTCIELVNAYKAREAKLGKMLGEPKEWRADASGSF